MSNRDRVAQAICRAENRIIAERADPPVVIHTWEDDAELYLALADAAIEEMREIENVHVLPDLPVAFTDDTTKRGTRLPEDWMPSQKVRAELSQQYPGVNLNQLLAEFIDYWCAVPGQRGLKLSWDRTFRNSVRERAHKPQYRLRQPGGQSRVDAKAADYLSD